MSSIAHSFPDKKPEPSIEDYSVKMPQINTQPVNFCFSYDMQKSGDHSTSTSKISHPSPQKGKVRKVNKNMIKFKKRKKNKTHLSNPMHLKEDFQSITTDEELPKMQRVEKEFTSASKKKPKKQRVENLSALSVSANNITPTVEKPYPRTYS
ncbi:unnamed protein product [Moneuplotes crassus]|uniref:Uncharacterized protein n=1 Tax=Euplotes crassus TaxID=5936 RepID=A0AAD1TZL0_EUPCR|nr:unnamed protein product [Moneuplotes crassus]